MEVLAEETLKVSRTEPATTGSAPSIAFVPKKDRTLRFCIGDRQLNAVIVRDVYLIQRINEGIDPLKNANNSLRLMPISITAKLRLMKMVLTKRLS